MTISIIALILSGLAAAGTCFIAWFGSIRPAKLVGILSKIYFSASNSDSINIMPSLFIKNTGAHDAIVELVRLKFFNKTNVSYANLQTLHPYRDLRVGAEDFAGFVLSDYEVWTNVFFFLMKKNKYERLAHHKVKIEIEVRLVGKDKWIKIKSNDFNFSIQDISKNYSVMSPAICSQNN